MTDILRFEFLGKPDPEAVEADMALAIFAAECVYGKPRIRLEASYLVANGGRDCILKSDGEAGDAVARILAGLAAVRVGETAFRVRHVEDEGNSQHSASPEPAWVRVDKAVK